MDASDPGARELVQAAVDDHGFLSWLDLRVESVGVGRISMRVPFDETLTNSGPGTPGGIHGGIAATLVDTAGGIACRTEFDDPTAGVATVDLNVSYLRTASDDLVATAETVRVGNTIGVARVDVTSETPDGEEATVAVGRGSYRLFRGEE